MFSRHKKGWWIEPDQSTRTVQRNQSHGDIRAAGQKSLPGFFPPPIRQMESVQAAHGEGFLSAPSERTYMPASICSPALVLKGHVASEHPAAAWHTSGGHAQARKQYNLDEAPNKCSNFLQTHQPGLPETWPAGLSDLHTQCLFWPLSFCVQGFLS